MSDGRACPSCGSKRTTEIAAAEGRPGAIWCHACGAVTDAASETRDRLSREVEEVLASTRR